MKVRAKQAMRVTNPHKPTQLALKIMQKKIAGQHSYLLVKTLQLLRWLFGMSLRYAKKAGSF